MVQPDENAGVSILVSPRTTLIKNILPSAAITLLLRNKPMKFNCDFSYAFYLWFGYAEAAQVWHKHLVKAVRISLHSLYKAIFSSGRLRARQGVAVSGCISAGLAGYNTSDLIHNTRTSQCENNAYLITGRNLFLVL